MRTSDRQCSASVLIITIWILAFLAFLAIAMTARISGRMRYAYAMAMRFESDVAVQSLSRVLRETIREESSNTIYFITQPRANTSSRDFALITGKGHIPITSESRESRVKARVLTLEDENRRLNINAIPLNRDGATILGNLISLSSGSTRQTALSAACAFIDWRDGSNGVFSIDTGAAGAENEYYGRLTPPYAAHDGPLTIKEELPLVKGFNSLFTSRLADNLTIYGNSAMVNINTVHKDVLQSIGYSFGSPNAVDTLVEEIINQRSAELYTNRTLILQRLQKELSSEQLALLYRMLPMLDVQSTHFHATLGAFILKDNLTNSLVDIIIDREGKILQWREE